jgi:hypothetical protein
MYAGLFVTIQVAHIDWRTLVLGICHERGILLYVFLSIDSLRLPADRVDNSTRLGVVEPFIRSRMLGNLVCVFILAEAGKV